MDHSNTSAVSQDPEDDKSLVLQYEGRWFRHPLILFILLFSGYKFLWCNISFSAMNTYSVLPNATLSQYVLYSVMYVSNVLTWMLS